MKLVLLLISIVFLFGCVSEVNESQTLDNIVKEDSPEEIVKPVDVIPEPEIIEEESKPEIVEETPKEETTDEFLERNGIDLEYDVEQSIQGLDSVRKLAS